MQRRAEWPLHSPTPTRRYPTHSASNVDCANHSFAVCALDRPSSRNRLSRGRRARLVASARIWSGCDRNRLLVDSSDHRAGARARRPWRWRICVATAASSVACAWCERHSGLCGVVARTADAATRCGWSAVVQLSTRLAHLASSCPHATLASTPLLSSSWASTRHTGTAVAQCAGTAADREKKKAPQPQFSLMPHSIAHCCTRTT